jgi:hypothetical protein
MNKTLKKCLFALLLVGALSVGYMGTSYAMGTNIWTEEYALKHGDKPNPESQNHIKVNIKNSDGQIVYTTNAKFFNENTDLVEVQSGYYFGSEENKEYFKEGKFINKPSGPNGKADRAFLNNLETGIKSQIKGATP